MSKPILAVATVQALRQLLSLPSSECDHMPDGQPPARCGHRFVAVHYGGQSNTCRNSLDREFDLAVTVTMRLAAPRDRAGMWLARRNTRDGLEQLCEEIVRALHMSYPVINRANVLLESENPVRLPWATITVHGYSEPFHFASDAGDPREVGADWFGAVNESEEGGLTAPAGYTQELRFAGARRLQPNEELRVAWASTIITGD